MPLTWGVLGACQGPGAGKQLEELKDLRSSGRMDELASASQQLLKELPPGASAARYEAEWYLAGALGVKNDPLGAMEHAQRASSIARELRDTSRMLGSLYQLTKLDVEGRHYQEADRHRREHLSLARAYGKDVGQLVLALNSMGSMHSRLEDRDSAEYYFREGLRVLGDEAHIARLALLGNLASLLGEKGAHAEAERLLRQAVSEVDSTDLRNKAWALNNLGQALMHARRYNEAIAVLNESDSLNTAGGGAIDLAIELAEIRAQCLDSLRDHKGAYQWIKHARDLQDTLFERSMNEQLLELEARFGTRLKEEEIQRLDAQGREQAERLRLRNIQLYGSLILVVLALGGIVLIWRNLRQKRRHGVVLERLNAELSDQRSRVEEINRLLQLKVLRTQMNPHFIYNSLNAIHNLVRKGDSTSASAYLDGFARLLRMVLDHSVRERVPLADEIAFLRQYIKLEALRFEDGLDYSVDAEQVLLNDDDLLVPTLLVQPFVENAIWHGLAPKQGDRRLRVKFTEQQGELICTIEDNGVGRDAAPDRAHSDGSPSMGLQLTTERLQLLAFKLEGTGRIRFTDLKTGSAPAGTKVEVVLSDL
ncbi:MAG: histidine kinase [Flavobacteriales bacterium]